MSEVLSLMFTIKCLRNFDDKRISTSIHFLETSQNDPRQSRTNMKIRKQQEARLETAKKTQPQKSHFPLVRRQRPVFLLVLD